MAKLWIAFCISTHRLNRASFDRASSDEPPNIAWSFSLEDFIARLYDSVSWVNRVTASELMLYHEMYRYILFACIYTEPVQNFE